MKTLIRQYKPELKKQAKQIREMKDQRKGSPNGYVSGLDTARRNYRLKHIAYCLMRGRTLEQIEGHTGIKQVCGAWKEIERLMLGIKMYVLVRRDLPKSQQTVQACHAVSKFFTQYKRDSLKERLEAWDHTKVILAVDDAEELMRWYRRFPIFESGITLFREPDLRDHPTAFSILLKGDEGEILKGLSLL